ncbi:MAG: tetratricopeptide repeat protein [Coriobacteriia bacterium]|nr:tetratricopeptide repeat protein [Coriobacteriia bacterium]
MTANAGDRLAGQRFPRWFVFLVLILMLALAGLGGYVVRGLMVDKDAVTPDDAVADWEQKVTEDPDDLDSHLSLGFAYQQDKEYDKALEQYDQVLAKEAGNTAALYNKAVIYMETGQPKLAEETYWDVLEVVPDHVLAAKALGEYYMSKEQYKSALVALELVVEKRPEFADLQYLAGVCYEKLGRTADAIERYREALRYAPDFIDARDALTALGVQ